MAFCEKCTAHPECTPDEVFLTNLDPDNPNFILLQHGGKSDLESIGWKTKRMGKAAYDIWGQRIPEYRPVFVQKSELEQAGRDLSALCNCRAIKKDKLPT